MVALPISKNFIATLLCGVFSAILGLIELDTPGFEQSFSDLREIGLLICLFHIRNPFYVIPLCLLTLLGLPFELRLMAVFLMHVIPLFIIWYAYKWVEQKHLSNIRLGLMWGLISVVYYLILLYPMLIFSYQLFDIQTSPTFFQSYRSLFYSGTFEVVATSLITSLYLVQLNIRKSLQSVNKNLEEAVIQRTQELSYANQELQSLNSNLEDLVKERTKRIDAQLNQILKYAHMNAHEVRAPVARILGLMNLIKNEKNDQLREELLQKLDVTSVELDVIVRKMNQLLEQELDGRDD